jgi:2-keto-3-deoxy-L-rhamnonate aldolase RhmA/NAD(P)-dependent dehydrogenase (short-subunit alcohol dehydrogenase family)
MTAANPLLERLASGGAVGSLWVGLGSVAAAEVMAEGRPDAMIFDMQHGLWDRRSLYHGFAAVRAKTEPVVRVAANDPAAIGDALDLGAVGVIVPLIESAEEARAAVAAAKYPPEGRRSAGGVRTMLDFTPYAKAANRQTLLSVMIETEKGLKSAAAIAAVPGVDLIFIGPSDLSLSLGVFPDLGAKHEQALHAILAACRKAGKPCGLFTFHSTNALDRLRQGFQWMVLGNDQDFLQAAGRANVARFAGGERGRIAGTIALVTGTSRGIGPEIVKALLAAGAAKIYCGARNPKKVAKLVARAPDKLIPVALDITKEDQVAAAAKACKDVSLLVNNAGVNFNTPLLGIESTDNARREMEVNYFGTLAMCRAFAPILKKAKGRGTIVNMLSILAHANLPLMGSLSASKAAGLSLTQGVRAELAGQGTRVVAVLPGAVDTDMTRGVPVPKIQPAEVAAAIVHGLEYGLEEIYPGDMASGMAAGHDLDSKALEKQLAGFLPPAK